MLATINSAITKGGLKVVSQNNITKSKQCETGELKMVAVLL